MKAIEEKGDSLLFVSSSEGGRADEMLLLAPYFGIEMVQELRLGFDCRYQWMKNCYDIISPKKKPTERRHEYTL